MARLSYLLLLLCATAYAQRNELWANPGLAERGVQPGEQQIMLRQDMSQCHGTAFERARGIEDEQKRKALGIALFKQCMAEKGWYARQPGTRKPAPKAPRETAT
ncbi:MAG TPA: hypothetical protein VEQ87_09825 [Burkholderiales bacterium]|nr:hypothetical protein [Burkholderiales bacterium]